MSGLAFLDTECAAEECDRRFHPRRDTQRFCSRSCAGRTTARSRVASRNSNWRGGKTSHPLYETWLDMIGRCHRTTHQRFESYGGRGVTVCERWRLDFWAFVADMGERPIGRSLDRIDNDAGYTPENCRWATASEQSRNRRPLAYAGSRRDIKTGRFLGR